jgi:hypothetical protein
MSQVDTFRWRLIATGVPQVMRRCPRCNVRQAFEPSGKFRVNGSGRRLDVWLIYKCTVCDTTWNCTIFERVTPESLDPDLYQAFMDNDDATVRRYAFDLENLRRNRAELGPELPHVVEGEVPDIEALVSQWIVIEIVPVDPVPFRVDHLVGARLGLSRRLLDRLVESGAATLNPGGSEMLRRRAKGPVTVRFERAALVEARAEAQRGAELRGD